MTNPREVTNKFRNASNARMLRGIFYEWDSETGIYTLKDEDTFGLPSLYRLYMECEDLTEYDFAVTHLDGWEHWERLTKATWFQEHITRWRREKEVRARSRALKKIAAVAQGDSRDAVQANKYLLDGKWVSGDTKVGRKTKAAVQEEIKKIALEDKVIDDDYDRVIN